MKDMKFYKIKEELHNKIVTVAYGDAGLVDIIKIYFLTLIYPNVKALLNEYKLTYKSVRSIEKEFMPEILLEKVKSKTNTKKIKNDSFFFDFYTFIYARPLVSAAAVTLLVVGLIASALIKKPDYSITYSKEEIALANKQTRQAFAIVSGVLTKTENTLKNEILAKRVGHPIQKGLNIVNELFNEENNNEKLN